MQGEVLHTGQVNRDKFYSHECTILSSSPVGARCLHIFSYPIHILSFKHFYILPPFTQVIQHFFYIMLTSRNPSAADNNDRVYQTKMQA